MLFFKYAVPVHLSTALLDWNESYDIIQIQIDEG